MNQDWNVQQTAEMTVITLPAEDSTTITTIAPSTTARTPSEIMRAAMPAGRMKIQVLHQMTTPSTPSRDNHVCNMWSIAGKKAGIPGMVILMRACASKDGFNGCGRQEAFEMLPDDAARLLYSKLKKGAL